MSDIMDDFEDDYEDYLRDDDFDEHILHCGAVDDKRLCADIGSEWCSFHCRFYKIYVTDRQNSPEYDLLPEPPDDVYGNLYDDTDREPPFVATDDEALEPPTDGLPF